MRKCCQSLLMSSIMAHDQSLFVDNSICLHMYSSPYCWKKRIQWPKSDLTIMGAHVATQLQHVKLWHMTYIIKLLTSIIIIYILYLHYTYLYIFTLAYLYIGYQLYIATAHGHRYPMKYLRIYAVVFSWVCSRNSVHTLHRQYCFKLCKFMITTIYMAGAGPVNRSHLWKAE